MKLLRIKENIFLNIFVVTKYGTYHFPTQCPQFVDKIFLVLRITLVLNISCFASQFIAFHFTKNAHTIVHVSVRIKVYKCNVSKNHTMGLS